MLCDFEDNATLAHRVNLYTEQNLPCGNFQGVQTQGPWNHVLFF